MIIDGLDLCSSIIYPYAHAFSSQASVFSVIFTPVSVSCMVTLRGGDDEIFWRMRYSGKEADSPRHVLDDVIRVSSFELLTGVSCQESHGGTSGGLSTANS